MYLREMLRARHSLLFDGARGDGVCKKMMRVMCLCFSAELPLAATALHSITRFES